ncbi:kinase-like domain-containing protein [Mycena epipterygia]|nr:kinase-like domain-containing protein [Mycena epipterygia]
MLIRRLVIIITLQISSSLGVAEDRELTATLDKDQAAVAHNLELVLYSPVEEQNVLALEGDDAQSFLDMIQDTLNKALIRTNAATGKARRLMGKLAKACDKLPTSLIIFGVTERDDQASFSGGFGEVFRAMYQGKAVALKRMRMLQTTDQRRLRQKFGREALVWQSLDHPYILPLIGIDTETFAPLLCMVSPWMKNGIVTKYLSTIGATSLRTTIREIAEGLAYLHDRKVVHGDLRGSNILVDDTGHACLADFGLTVLTDATANTESNTGAGSVRWMAPETLTPPVYARTPESDIYAFGCVCLEVSRSPLMGAESLTGGDYYSSTRDFRRSTMQFCMMLLLCCKSWKVHGPAGQQGTPYTTIFGISWRNAGFTIRRIARVSLA